MFRSTRSRPRRAAFAAIALAVALGASTVSAGGAGAAVATQKKEKIDKAAVLRFGAPIEEQGGVFFDPSSSRAAANPTSRMWMDLIYGTMIEQTEDGKGAPGLALEWSTPDANTVELELREGVKFSDGTAFNAAAVKAAWDRFIASDRPNKGADTEAMTSVDAVDEYTVRINLSQPVATNFVNDALKNAVHLGVPSPTAAAAGNLDAAPVGAGPYKLVSYETGKITLDRNPAYYNKKAQRLAGHEMTNVALGAPGVSALTAANRTVDLIWSFPPDAVGTLEGTPGVQVYSAPSARQFQIALCPTEGVFAAKEARQAVNFAVDRAAIDAGALEGTGPPNSTVLTKTSPFFNKTLAKRYKYDPKKATALLKQANVAPGTKVSMLVPAQPPYEAIAEIVQSQLEEVGLEAEITKTSSFAADAQRVKPDLMAVSLDPTTLSIAYVTESPLNPCAWSDPEVVAALNATRAPGATDAELQAAWDEFQELIIDEAPSVITNLQGLLAAHTDKVKGLTIINSPYGPQLNTVYMVK